MRSYRRAAETRNVGGVKSLVTGVVDFCSCSACRRRRSVIKGDRTSNPPRYLRQVESRREAACEAKKSLPKRSIGLPSIDDGEDVAKGVVVHGKVRKR
eukprot:scaffold144129_cov28-Tisochrysis_lutea.AAC.1